MPCVQVDHLGSRSSALPTLTPLEWAMFFGRWVPDEFLAWAATLALEMRRRVKEAQAFIGAAEFGKTDLSYRIGDSPETIVYCDETVRHRMRMETEAGGGRPTGGERQNHAGQRQRAS